MSDKGELGRVQMKVCNGADGKIAVAKCKICKYNKKK